MAKKNLSVNYVSQADFYSLSEVRSNFLKLQFGLFLQDKLLSQEVLSNHQDLLNLLLLQYMPMFFIVDLYYARTLIHMM